MGKSCYGKVFGYDAPNIARGWSHVGNFLRDFNFKLADWCASGVRQDFEFRAYALSYGVLRLDNAWHSVDVAVAVRVLRASDGRDNVARRSGGVIGVHA